uniref:Uncharacterized protein n=1 Tax=Anguilla anguilla TaxID=7936 RepID=A0A0E9SYM6_ANGAN
MKISGSPVTGLGNCFSQSQLYHQACKILLFF